MPAGDLASQHRALQAQLREIWPTMTPRPLEGANRSVVVVHSVNIEIPPHLLPVIPAYEERFLCLVLILLGQPRSRVVYVTSQPILPRLVDYYFGLVPGMDTADARSRLSLVSVGDGSSRPLIQKILCRPHLVERIGSLVPDRDRAFIAAFQTTEREAELGVRLGIPVYGPDPSYEHLGTKSGSRRIFAEEGVPHPAGAEGLRGVSDLLDAIGELRSSGHELREVILKLDDAAGGMGNALVRLDGASTRREIEERLWKLEVDEGETPAEAFLASLDSRGGIVEERIVGSVVRSPSVQCRVSPDGDVEVLSTHDQDCGGANGLTYLGCRFPADREYVDAVTREGVKVASRLAAEGVIGRFSIDFVATHEKDGWRLYAVEINLRNGGTTHPMLVLQALADGEYDVARGELSCPDGRAKYYLASDHLESPLYEQLTPDDVLDVVVERGLRWDVERRTGVALHMVSAVAVAGRVGVTAIGDSPAEAEQLYRKTKQALDEAVPV